MESITEQALISGELFFYKTSEQLSSPIILSRKSFANYLDVFETCSSFKVKRNKLTNRNKLSLKYILFNKTE